jgi:hypothetical protein
MQRIFHWGHMLVANWLTRTGVLLLMGLAGAATTAQGQFGPRTNASYSLNGSVSVTGLTGKTFIFNDAADGGPTFNPVEVRLSEGESLGLANIAGNVLAFADVGSLAVGAQGIAISQTSSPPGQIISSSAEVNINHVRASWSDRARIASGSQPAGKPVRVNFSLNLSGGFTAQVSQNFDHPLSRARAASQIFISGTDVPAMPDGRFGSIFKETVGSSTTSTMMPPPSKIPMQWTVQLGVPKDFDYTLEVRGAASLLRQPSEMQLTSADFDAHFGGTLKWGGITSVTDAETGELIDDWIIESESGFNYANPVPEPTGSILLAVAVAGLPRRGRWRAV